MAKVKTLVELTKEEFYELKASGMLWEFYPDAPQFYQGIRDLRCSGCNGASSGMCHSKEVQSNSTGTKGE